MDGTGMRPTARGFNVPFGRANEEQRKKYNVTLDKISEDFKKNWPNMSDEEKMKWKFQRYMQDYLPQFLQSMIMLAEFSII